MQFRDYLNQKKKPIEKEMQKVLLIWKNKVDHESPQLKKITDLLLFSNTHGKRIRGVLICLGYDLYKTSSSKAVYSIAGAYELLHCSLLIHDDIMDNSLLRRGHPTIHQYLGANHYALSQAICLGDVGFFLALDLLTNVKKQKEKISQIVPYFTKIIQETITGQMLDIYSSQNLSSISEKQVIQIATLKTGYYTIVAPLVIGALLAGAKKDLINKLSNFGEHLGIAFQIKDDILGIIGDEQSLGKSIKSDIEEGKSTLPFVYAKQQATKEQKYFLMNHYGKGKMSKEQYIKIKKIFIDSGAILKAEERLNYHAMFASKLIPSLTKDAKKRALFQDFVQFLIERKR